MDRRWRIRPHDTDLISRMMRDSSIPAVLAQLLASRGITEPGLVQGFFDTKLSQLRDPELLPGLSAAADQIIGAVRAGRRLTIYGDYDADGMTSTALLYRCLSLVGANVSYYVPNRMDEGYGLNDTAIERLAQSGTEMLISVDCGIASVAEAQTARRLGVELIITDHHQFGTELPEATLVHPQLPGHDYPFPSLCGAGVAFKLAWALCQRVSEAKRVSKALREFLLSALSLAAIGTVADVVPLLDENRVIVKHGLVSLKSRPTPGLECLLRLAQAQKKPALTSEDIAFGIAPRRNAAGRLGQAQLGVELLATEDAERAKALAEYLDELNNNRLHLERSIYLAANKQIKDRFDPADAPALVLADRGWHQGVIGIVAGRLSERYHRPVIMIALDELGAKPGTGSARSIPGLDLHATLAACDQYLVKHGGHAAAAGLRIDEAQVDPFRQHFCEQVEQRLSTTAITSDLLIDAETSLAEMRLKTVEEIERLAPFGEGNRRPLLSAATVQIVDGPRAMGKGDRHMNATVRQHNGPPFRILAFNRSEWIEEIAATDGELDIAFRPTINDFAGRRKVELHLEAWRTSRADAPTNTPS